MSIVSLETAQPPFWQNYCVACCLKVWSCQFSMQSNKVNPVLRCRRPCYFIQHGSQVRCPELLVNGFRWQLYRRAISTVTAGLHVTLSAANIGNCQYMDCNSNEKQVASQVLCELSKEAHAWIYKKKTKHGRNM